jgi:hypothetical protein
LEKVLFAGHPARIATPAVKPKETIRPVTGHPACIATPAVKPKETIRPFTGPPEKLAPPLSNLQQSAPLMKNNLKTTTRKLLKISKPSPSKNAWSYSKAKPIITLAM